MKPSGSAARPKNAVPFTNFAEVGRIGDKVRLTEHLFPFVGNAFSPKDFIWGIYGTVSGSRAMFLANEHALKSGKQMLVLNGWYQLDNFEIVRTQIDRDMAETTGFLHFDRTSKDFREEIKEFLLKRAAKKYPGINAEVYRGKQLSDLVLSYPGLLPEVFKLSDKINMVVFPAHQVYDPVERRTLTIAVMRKNAQRVLNVEVRYRPDIEVAV